MTTEMRTPARPKSKHVAAIVNIALCVAVTLLLLWNLGALRSKPKVAMITSGEGIYWDQVIAGAQRAAQVCDVDLTVVKSKTDAPTQTQLIKDLLQQKHWDGVAISPINP